MSLPPMELADLRKLLGLSNEWQERLRDLVKDRDSQRQEKRDAETELNLVQGELDDMVDRRDKLLEQAEEAAETLAKVKDELDRAWEAAQAHRRFPVRGPHVSLAEVVTELVKQAQSAESRCSRSAEQVKELHGDLDDMIGARNEWLLRAEKAEAELEGFRGPKSASPRPPPPSIPTALPLGRPVGYLMTEEDAREADALRGDHPHPDSNMRKALSSPPLNPLKETAGDQPLSPEAPSHILT